MLGERRRPRRKKKKRKEKEEVSALIQSLLPMYFSHLESTVRTIILFSKSSQVDDYYNDDITLAEAIAQEVQLTEERLEAKGTYLTLFKVYELRMNSIV